MRPSKKCYHCKGNVKRTQKSISFKDGMYLRPSLIQIIPDEFYHIKCWRGHVGEQHFLRVEQKYGGTL